MVQGVGAKGGFLVLFDGYGTQEEVGKDAVQLRPAEEDETGYKGGRRARPLPAAAGLLPGRVVLHGVQRCLWHSP